MRSQPIVAFAGCFLLAGSLFLSLDAGDLQPDLKKPAADKKEEKSSEVQEANADEEILRRAEVPTDGEGLLKYLRKRSLSESERPVIEQMVRQLRSTDYRVREKANQELLARGAAVLEILRSPPVTVVDLELVRRVKSAIERIRDKDVAPEIPAAAVRVLALRKPSGLVEALLGYLPYADNEAVVAEIRLVLAREAANKGKSSAQLLTALSDRAAIRRAVAAQALGHAAFAEHKEKLRKLLQDPDPLVRLRVAQTFAYAREREGIPALIDTLVDSPLNTAWETEDFLLRLTAGSSPPSVAMSNDKNGREKCRLAWQSWWKKHGGKVDLSKLAEPAPFLGLTLVVLLDQGKVVELGPDNWPRWEIKGLVFPLDAQLLGEERVLVAEYHANRVTERNTRGEILWQTNVVGPLAAQRLANGNTFVATDSQFFEYDKEGKEVLNVTIAEEGRRIMKAMKLPNGEIASMLADARVVRYDAKGQELSSFPIALSSRLFGGRVHMLPTGRVLVPHNAEGKVVEYDSQGKAVWEVAFEQPVAAVRLANGNTIITSMNPAVGAVEVDRLGTQVWSYRHTTRVTRAIRR